MIFIVYFYCNQHYYHYSFLGGKEVVARYFKSLSVDPASEKFGTQVTELTILQKLTLCTLNRKYTFM